MKPLCIDLFCGLGGWAEGFLAEGYDVIGFDLERRPYPGHLVLQDVLTLHGSQFRNAAVIVASPPCQEPSRYAMPFGGLWREHNRMDDDGGPPIDYVGKPVLNKFRALFDACFRIQREANEAAYQEGCIHCGAVHPATRLDGCEFQARYIPLVVENVCGAQKWVGRAAWHFASFYLWGDVPALMPTRLNGQKVPVYSDPRRNGGRGVHLTSPRENLNGIKNGKDWFASGENCSLQRKAASGSSARKQASAEIAKIPFDLANHIARVYRPDATCTNSVRSGVEPPDVK